VQDALAWAIALQDGTAALAEAVTLDDVARAVLASVVRAPGVVRAGLALEQGAGRELRFVSTDLDAIGAAGVRWCSIDGLADVPLTRAASRGETVLLRSLDDLRERYPHLAERQAAFGTRAMAALPLVAGGSTLGGLLISLDRPCRFSEHDVAALGAIASQAAHAVRRARAYEQQHTTAEALQRTLLPPSLPRVDGLAFGARYESGGRGVDVGGDWYDVAVLDDGRVAAVVGDVMGKGLPAAAVMGQVRAALRAYALLDPAPAVVLERLDALVRSLGDPEQFVTVAYGLLSADRSRLDVAVAGHLPPVVLGPRGPARLLDVEAGPPLGAGTGRAHRWSAAAHRLEPGSLVVLFSDGLVDARGRPLADGLEELRAAVAELGAERREPRELTARLVERLRREDPADDVVVLAVATTTGRHVRQADVRLPADTTAPRLARRFLHEHLGGWGLPASTTLTAELCLSELVTNAVIHSGTPARVVLDLDDQRLLVLVEDGGTRGVVRRQHLDPEDVGGRGLALVEELSTAWNAERTAVGTTVWFELSRASRQPA
jgi:serine phosphatase RsbU (regulator of sigma subunit)/anti-sigma regulatory factor (Ser/Thr protein kinase)